MVFLEAIQLVTSKKSRLTKSYSGAQNMKIILKLLGENFLVMTYVIIYIGLL